VRALLGGGLVIASELRRGLLITLSDIAHRSGLSIVAIEHIERGLICDLRLSDLALYVEGLGGRLEAIIPAPHGTERKVVL
jgi:hypothetical protein